MSAASTLRPKQLETVLKAEALGLRCPIFNEPRTGKTRSALALVERAALQRVAVIGLNQFLHVWDQEAQDCDFQGPPLTYLNTGPVPKRGLLLRDIVKAKQPATLVLNYDAWWRSDLRAQLREFKPELIIYDEAHRLIARGNRSARFAHQISTRESWYKHAIPMTATWQERGFEDIFGIFKACNPTVFGKDYYAFANEWLIVATNKCRHCGLLLAPGHVEPFCDDNHHKGPVIPWNYGAVIGYRNQDKLFERIRVNSCFATQAESNIPKPDNTIIPIKLTPATRKQYDLFMKKLVHEFQAIDHAPQKIKADRVLTALIKAQEITGGFIMDGAGNTLELSHEKLDQAVELAHNEQSQGWQHAIFCKFDYDVVRLAKALKIPLDMTYTGYAGTGEKGQQRRKEILAALKSGALPYLIGNVDMCSLGLNLSVCRTATYYSTGWSFIDLYQLDARLQAPGKYPEHYHLVATDTIDERIYEALARKQNLHDAVFDNPSLNIFHEALKAPQFTAGSLLAAPVDFEDFLLNG